MSNYLKFKINIDKVVGILYNPNHHLLLWYSNNKNINNLYISRSDTNYIGLFGYIDNGTIKKLNLSDVNVAGGDYTGALTGRTYQAYIYSINV